MMHSLQAWRAMVGLSGVGMIEEKAKAGSVTIETCFENQFI